VTGVVERLERHATRHRAVTDHRDDPLIAPAGVAGLREPERDGDRVRRMACVESVVGTLVALREPADAAILAQRREALGPAREDLVDVALMPHVPDHAVLRRVERAEQPDREFHDPEVRRQVPAGARDRVHEQCPDLAGEQPQ
jgi:hypothetical protein